MRSVDTSTLVELYYYYCDFINVDLHLFYFYFLKTKACLKLRHNCNHTCVIQQPRASSSLKS